MVAYFIQRERVYDRAAMRLLVVILIDREFEFYDFFFIFKI